MRALVTGGCGFIGSHVVELLLARGDDVVILDSLDARVHAAPPTVPQGARLVVGDVRDARAVEDAVGRGVDAVFHEAAMVGVGRGAADARAFIDVNVGGTIALIETLARAAAPPERIILASTMALYGEGAYACDACGTLPGSARRDPADLARGMWEPRCRACDGELRAVAASETHPPRPETAYAISKLAQEQMATSVGRDLGIPVVALRYHNVYGARMPRDTPYAGVASVFKSRALAGAPPLVHEDGAQLRDFVRVEDVARANLLALDAPLARVAHEAFNVGTGRPRPILDLARGLCDALAPGIAPRVTGAYRAGDARHVFASIDKARAALRYEPSIPFEEGIEAFARESVRDAPREVTPRA